MNRRELSVRLEDAAPAPVALNAALCFPEETEIDALLICLPGGGASRHYFELGEHDGINFDFASRMSAHGFASLMIDHPGTGENPLPDDYPFLTPRAAADILVKAIPIFCEQAGFAPRKMVGIGHSMGGMIIALMQARHGLFDSIAMLGASARGLDWGLTEEEKKFLDRPAELEANLEQLVMERYGALYPGGMGGPSGKSITFGGSSAEMTRRLRAVSTPLYAAGGTTSMVRGGFAPEAGAIDVPIFFAFGDHDIGAPPAEVAQDFANSPAIETMLLKQTGHNHFAFPSIAQLCDGLAQWISD